MESGPSPRIIIAERMSNWFFATSRNYINGYCTALPKQYSYILPENYDIDGNEYVSVGESYDTCRRSQEDYFSEYPDQRCIHVMRDNQNIAKNSFLGDFNVQDFGSPFFEDREGTMDVRIIVDRVAIETENGYKVTMAIGGYGKLCAQSLDLSSILYNQKPAVLFGEFAPVTNPNSPINFYHCEFEKPSITFKVGEDSPWQKGSEITLSLEISPGNIHRWQVLIPKT